MNWFHWVLLGSGLFFAVSTPVVLVKAIQRKEWQRLYELVIWTLWMPGFLLMTALPTAIENTWAAWPPLRWLWLLCSLLFLANFFGFSRLLFNRHRKRQI